MKKTLKITFCGIIAAFSVVIMLLAYFPYFTYAVPAIAGTLTVMVFIEIGAKWSVAVYIVTSLLCLILAEPEAKLMYILFFGYYPIIKVYIERIRIKILQIIVKLSVFNVSVLSVYLLFANIVGISTAEFTKYGIYGLIGLLVLANFTFVLYDLMIVRLTNMYLIKFHNRISKTLKKG